MGGEFVRFFGKMISPQRYILFNRYMPADQLCGKLSAGVTNEHTAKVAF